MLSLYQWGTSARMFTGNIIVMPGCLSPRYQFQSSQRLNFLDLRLNKKLCLGFSVTTYSMNACDEYLHPCDLIRGSTMLCLPLMGILDSVWLSQWLGLLTLRSSFSFQVFNT